MRKLRNYLSLFLLALAGITNVNAQSYTVDLDNPIMDIEEAVGKPVFIRTCDVASENRYMSGTKSSTTTDDNAVYYFEASGKTVLDTDGTTQLPTYYLKQFSTGKYLKDQKNLAPGQDSSDQMPEDREDPNDYVVYTTNKDEAFEFTALTWDGESETGRRGAINKGSHLQLDNILSGGFIFTRAKAFETSDEGSNYVYIGYLGNIFLSPYTDTNVWDLFPALEATPEDYLLTGLNAIAPQGYDSYTAGDDPGLYAPAALQAAKDAYDAANALYDTANFTLEQAKKAIADLKAADDALKAAVNPMREGYFFIHDNRQGTQYWIYASGQNMKIAGNPEISSPVTAEQAPYIWKLTKAEGTDQWYFQNYGTGEYATLTRNGNAVQTGSTPDAYEVKTATTAGFNIYNPAKKAEAWNSFHNQGLVLGFWQDFNDLGNCWSFKGISQSEIDVLEEIVAQQRLNNALKDVYDKAEATYSGARTFKADGATPDHNFDDPGLVTAAEALSSNALSTGEPADKCFIGALIDGDVNTYFHSAWGAGGAPQPATWHYLQADLGQQVSTVLLKYGQRLGQVNICNPTKLQVFATNTPEDEASWVDCGSLALTYSIPLPPLTEDGTQIDNFFGMAGIELPAAYRHFRFEVRATTSDKKYDGYPFWYLSELRYYAGEYDAENSIYNVVSESVRTAFEAQLANAKAKLSAGAATQDDIDKLKAAYDALIVELPDPARLTKAITDAETVNDAAIIGTEVGTYSEEAKAKLTAAIETANNAVKPVMQIAEIEAAISALNAAVTEFKASIILPEAGKYYLIRSKGVTVPEAMVYSSGTARQSGIKYTAQVALDPDNEESEKADAIQHADHPNHVWVIEKAAAGKIVIRNLATGMYIGSQTENAGAVEQSLEPVEHEVFSVGTAGQFTFKVSDGGYFNVNRNGTLVAWNDVNDGNAKFAVEEVESNSFSADGTFYLKVSAGQYQVMTLNYDILGYVVSDNSALYSLVGQNDNNQLVLAQINGGEIKAGTPFIYKSAPSGELTNGEEGFYLTKSMNNGAPEYNFEATEVNGLQGVLYEAVTPALNTAVFYNGQLFVLSEGSADYLKSVSAGSGYFNGKHALGVSETGDALVTIPEGSVINSIENVVILPETVNVYNTSGVLVRQGVKSADAVKGLPAGIYVVGGQKLLVK